MKQQKSNNNDSTITVAIEEDKEKEKEKAKEETPLINETAPFIEDKLDIRAICEDYYASKLNGDTHFNKKCRCCNSKLFHINELLHFSSIQDFLAYIDYLFKYKRNILIYDIEAIKQNREDIRKYIGKLQKYNEHWAFTYAKAICKGCMIMLLNKKNSINIIRDILKDPEKMMNTKSTGLLNNLSPSFTDYDALNNQINQTPHAYCSYPLLEMIEPMTTYKMTPMTQPSQSQQQHLLPYHISLWEKEVTEFNKSTESLNASILRTIEKFIKGAKLFNDLYQKSPIDNQNFEEYLNKIVSINNRNKRKASIIINTLSNYRKFLFSIIDHCNTFISTNKTTGDAKCMNFHLRTMLSQFDEQFNQYGNIVLGFAQTLNTLDALTSDYLDNLKEQSKIITASPNLKNNNQNSPIIIFSY